MRIRTLTEEDADAYRAVRLRMLRDHPEAFGSAYEEAVERPLSATAERLRPVQNEHFTLGAFDDGGSLIGTVTFDRNIGLKNRHKGFVTAVYVAPEARGRGIGRALLEALIAETRTIAGVEQLYLGVATTNAPAQRLYRILGFVPYALEPHALKIGDGYVDEEHMILRLV